jgi:hypothetical protein
MAFSSEKLRAASSGEAGVTGFIGFDEMAEVTLPSSFTVASASAENGDLLIAAGLQDNTGYLISTPSEFTSRLNDTGTRFFAFTDDAYSEGFSTVSISAGATDTCSAGLVAFRGYVFDDIGDLSNLGTTVQPGSITLTSNDSIVVCIAGHFGGASASQFSRPAGYDPIFRTSQLVNSPDPYVCISYLTGVSSGSYTSGTVSLSATGKAFLIGLRPV